MLNQRASISHYSYSNPSLLHYQRRLNRARKNRVRNASIDYLEVLKLKEVNETILNKLQEYLFKRKLILICSFFILLLISLNSVILVVHTSDCNTFNLCSIDNDVIRPFFWSLIGINLTLFAVLIFILLHILHIKQFYAHTLNNLIKLEFKNKRFYATSTNTAMSSISNSLDNVNRSNFGGNGNLYRSLEVSNINRVPSISIENFDDRNAMDRNAMDRNAIDRNLLVRNVVEHHGHLNNYYNVNFESDDLSKRSIELSEPPFSTSSSGRTSPKDSSS